MTRADCRRQINRIASSRDPVHFEFETPVSARPEELFAFHALPVNIEAISPRRSATRVLHSDGNIAVGSTTWLEVRVALFLPVVLGFRHVVCEAPARFVEELIHGPFERLRHEHQFVPQTQGTLVRDLLEVRLPAHYGGERAMRLVVAPHLRRLFSDRHAALRSLVEDATIRGSR